MPVNNFNVSFTVDSTISFFMDDIWLPNSLIRSSNCPLVSSYALIFSSRIAFCSAIAFSTSVVISVWTDRSS